MGFHCLSAKVKLELEVECIYCKHKFKVEYEATNKYAMEKDGAKFFQDGAYHMCPNPECWTMSTGMETFFREEESDWVTNGKGFQDYHCAEDHWGPGPGGDYYHLLDEKGKEFVRLKR